MNLDYKILPFEIKSASGDGSEGNGYANAFHNIDAAQEIVAPGAFSASLPEFLATGFMGGLNHNWDMPIGRPTLAEEHDKGLYVGWKISDTAHGRDVKTLLKDGVIKKLSIGYRVKGAQELPDADAVTAYWQRVGYTPSAEDLARAAYGARLLTQIHLYEFSPVTVPANTMADITRVKADIPGGDATIEDFEHWLRDVARCSRGAAKAAISRLKALLRDAAEEPDSPDTPPAPSSEDTAPETPPEAGEPPPAPPPPPPVLAASSSDVLAGYLQFVAVEATSLRLRAR